MAVGIQHHTEAAAGRYTPDDSGIGGKRRQRVQMWLFQCEEFARLFVRFPVNADICNRIHPVAGRRVQCVQAGRQLQAVEEILLYVPDTRFDTAFFVWPSHVTSTWLEAVVCCKVQVPRMKERPFSGRMLEHSGLRIVDDNFGRNSAKKLEGVLMGAQEVFGSLAEAKLEVTQAAVAKHHNKEREPSAS